MTGIKARRNYRVSRLRLSYAFELAVTITAVSYDTGLLVRFVCLHSKLEVSTPSKFRISSENASGEQLTYMDNIPDRWLYAALNFNPPAFVAIRNKELKHFSRSHMIFFFDKEIFFIDSPNFHPVCSASGNIILAI